MVDSGVNEQFKWQLDMSAMPTYECSYTESWETAPSV